MSLGGIISGISSIYNMFDDSAEDAAWQQHVDQQEALNTAQRYTDAAINTNIASKNWRYQNMMDIIAAQQGLENQSYNAYQDTVPGIQNDITNQFKDYYDKSQDQLSGGYGDATDVTNTSLQNAIDALNAGYDTGTTAGEAVNPYSDIIQDRLSSLQGGVNLNYDNDAAYAERERIAQENMNRQLLARGEYNSSEGLNQNREISTALALQNEEDDYNRALQMAELNRARTGEIASLVGSGLNTEQLRQGLGTTGATQGGQLADLYMTGGSNLANLATGLGTSQAGATQSMGQDITNLNTTQANANTARNNAYYGNLSNLYGNQLGYGQDIESDYNNISTSIRTGNQIPTMMNTNASNLYDSSMNTAAANTTNTSNLFSNLGTMYGAYVDNKTSGTNVSKNSDDFDSYVNTGKSKYFSL